MVQHGSDVLMQRKLRARSSAAESPDGRARAPALAQSAPGSAKTGGPGALGPRGRSAGGAAQADNHDDGSGGSADNSPAVSAPEWPPVRPGGAAALADSAAANGRGAEVGAAGFYGSGGARRRSEPARHAAPSQPVCANGDISESAARRGERACNGPVAQAPPPGPGLDQSRRPGAAAASSGGRAGLASGGGGKGSGELGAGSGARTSDPAAVRAFLQVGHTVCPCVVYVSYSRVWRG